MASVYFLQRQTRQRCSSRFILDQRSNQRCTYDWHAEITKLVPQILQRVYTDDGRYEETDPFDTE